MVSVIFSLYASKDAPNRAYRRRGFYRGRRFSGIKREAGRGRKAKEQTQVSSAASQSESVTSTATDISFVNIRAHPMVPFDKTCPFPGWLLYFPTCPYSSVSNQARYTKMFMRYIETALKSSHYDPYSATSQTTRASTSDVPVDWLSIEVQGAVLFDYQSLARSSLLTTDVPQVISALGENAEGGPASAEQCDIILKSMGLALHTLCYNALYRDRVNLDLFHIGSESLADGIHIPPCINGRIINHSPVTPLRDLRAQHLGRFISVKGIVIRVGPIEPLCRHLSFECVQCSSHQIMILPPDGRYSTPNRCATRGCHSRTFEPLLNHADTLTVDTQVITVQEATEHESDRFLDESATSASSLGRSPRCLTCRLSSDLADSCIPGDVVHLAGVITLLSADGLGPPHTNTVSWASRRSGNVFSLLLDVNSVTRVGGGTGISSNQHRVSGQNSSAVGPNLVIAIQEDSTEKAESANTNDFPDPVACSPDNDFSMKDLYAIREISEQPDLFRLLVASFCPSICGRSLVKAGLLLALFGGTQSPKRKRYFRSERRRNNNHSPCLSSDSGEAERTYGIGLTVGFAENDENHNDSSSDSATEAEENNPANTESTNLESDTFRRSTSHVLIVGDPGLGKSQLLRAAANLSPRVIYVSGNTASAAGLTVSTVRANSKSGGGFALEAGALILADQGCCCIDEFDKLACDPAVLLEAMEQQSISIARGGLVANLPARTAVLAAANPVGGHYDSTRRLDENLRIAPALLSRFDLIFVILDRPDEVADRLLSEHVTAVHTGTWKLNSFTCSPESKRSTKTHSSNVDPNAPLAERLELRLGEQLDVIPGVLMRKYIQYARKYVMPVLSEEAAMTLRDFYLELRRHRHMRDTFPVTLRQLESLIRLTQARARAELREEATKQDAMDVCELMRSTGLGTGHVGGTPANATLSQIARLVPAPSRHLVSDTGPAAAKRLLSAIELASRRTNSRLFTVAELQTLADGLGLSRSSLESLLGRLNEAGALLKQNTSLYKLI